MIYSNEFLDNLRRSIPLSSEVKKVTKIIRKGKEYIGNCPFHEDKTPSFFVNDEKGLYYCFGCGAKGDIFNFCSKYKMINFMEVIKYLAKEAGINLNKNKNHKDQEINNYNILEEACRFFENKLCNSNIGIYARNYLNNRKINIETQKKFRLGFAPLGNKLQDYLKYKGFSQQQMLMAGLLKQLDNSRKKNIVYEIFRNRLIFPIHNIYGHIVAFGGRTLDNIKPKYINSPESKIFKKRNILYGLKQGIEKNNLTKEIIVCEGYMDAISLYQKGFNIATATLGTALTGEQLNVLWQKTNNPIICFDGDNAGKKAIVRSINTILPILKAGKSVRFMKLPKNKDPNSLLLEDEITNDSFTKLLRSSMQLSDILWEYLVKKHIQENNPENLATLKKNFLTYISRIEDKNLKQCYIEDYYARFKNLKLQILRTKTSENIKTYVTVPKIYNAYKTRFKVLLASLINHPFLIKNNIEISCKLNIPKEWSSVFKDIVAYLKNKPIQTNNIKLKKYLLLKGHKITIEQIICEKTYIHGRFASPNSPPEFVYKGYLELLKICKENLKKPKKTNQNKKELDKSMPYKNWKKFYYIKIVN